ncbi:VCBS repeat-containing protein [Streptomyces sp. NPDC050423]|uniref:FG-GAP repeat domain-containing protein n=1 Tax=Streptomyces sp. NPDC050423 TaxID=3155402 RepID=UPI0034337D47
MTLRTSGTIDTVGTPEDIDITLTTPPTADSFVELDLDTENAAHLTVTDDSGAVLAHEPVYVSDSLATFRFGEEDSDHDGIPPVPPSPLARCTCGSRQTDMSGPVSTSTPITSTVPRATAYRSIPPMLSPAPASTRTRLTFTAQQIAKGGYTAAQLARDVHIQHSGDGVTYTERPWSIGADGSLRLDVSEHNWAAGTVKRSEYLRVTAVRGLPIGYLKGAFQTFAPDGTQLSQEPQTLEFIDQAAFYGRDGSGALWQYQSDDSRYSANPTARARIGGGWNTYNALTKLSTLKADGTGDLVARDKAGVLWLYKASGKTSAPFSARSKVGGGWNTYTQLAGPGDLTGDGKADLLARDSTGVLWLYRGTGSTSTPFTARTRIGSGWNAYTQLVGGTDLTGDGKADLLARDRDGVLWLYRGTGTAGAPFAARTQIGKGWAVYDTLT